jgi:hypothetical protein
MVRLTRPCIPRIRGIDRINAPLLNAFATGTPVSLYLADDTGTITEVILGGW